MHKFTINDLPSAVLVNIFEHVSVQSQWDFTSSPNHYARGGTGTIWDEDDHLRSPSLFPFSLHSVSQRWRSLMSNTPHFWTRCVVFIDPAHRRIQPVQGYFNNSEGLDMQVRLMWRNISSTPLIFVGYDNDNNSNPDARSEKSYVRAVLDILSPYASRCTALGIDTKYSTSLPPIIEFIGPQTCFQNLSLLKLHHHEAELQSLTGPTDEHAAHIPITNSDDLPHRQPELQPCAPQIQFERSPKLTSAATKTPPLPHAPPLSLFQSPKLGVLHIDGQNFAQLCYHGFPDYDPFDGSPHDSLTSRDAPFPIPKKPRALESLKGLQRLHVWHYHPPQTKPSVGEKTNKVPFVDFHLFMAVISQLNPYFLSLKDVDFPLLDGQSDSCHATSKGKEDNKCAQPIFYPIDIHELHLSCISSPLIPHLLSPTPSSTQGNSPRHNISSFSSSIPVTVEVIQCTSAGPPKLDKTKGRVDGEEKTKKKKLVKEQDDSDFCFTTPRTFSLTLDPAKANTDPEAPPTPPPAPSYTTSLFPTGLLIHNCVLYNAVLPGTGPSYLTLSEIPISPPPSLLAPDGDKSRESKTSDTSPNDLTISLSAWSGTQLTVVSCPGFNDDVLRMLARRHREARMSQPHHWLGGKAIVQKLRIIDCSNWTVGSLQRLVESSVGLDEVREAIEQIKTEAGPGGGSAQEAQAVPANQAQAQAQAQAQERGKQNSTRKRHYVWEDESRYASRLLSPCTPEARSPNAESAGPAQAQVPQAHHQHSRQLGAREFRRRASMSAATRDMGSGAQSLLHQPRQIPKMGAVGEAKTGEGELGPSSLFASDDERWYKKDGNTRSDSDTVNNAGELSDEKNREVLRHLETLTLHEMWMKSRMGVEEFYFEADTGGIKEIDVRSGARKREDVWEGEGSGRRMDAENVAGEKKSNVEPGGGGIPKIEEEDRQWFRARIDKFFWEDENDGNPPDGKEADTYIKQRNWGEPAAAPSGIKIDQVDPPSQAQLALSPFSLPANAHLISRPVSPESPPTFSPFNSLPASPPFSTPLLIPLFTRASPSPPSPSMHPGSGSHYARKGGVSIMEQDGGSDDNDDKMQTVFERPQSRIGSGVTHRIGTVSTSASRPSTPLPTQATTKWEMPFPRTESPSPGPETDRAGVTHQRVRVPSMSRSDKNDVMIGGGISGEGSAGIGVHTCPPSRASPATNPSLVVGEQRGRASAQAQMQMGMKKRRSQSYQGVRNRASRQVPGGEAEGELQGLGYGRDARDRLKGSSLRQQWNYPNGSGNGENESNEMCK